MRVYEIQTSTGSYRIECDEIPFKTVFLNETVKEPLCLFKEKRLVAIFKDWLSVLDITEKCLNVL